MPQPYFKKGAAVLFMTVILGIQSVRVRVCACACACPWDVGQLPLVPSAFCVINEQSSALSEVPHFLRDTLKGATGEATSCWLSVTSGSLCQ